jgi:hypothetical protein
MSQGVCVNETLARSRCEKYVEKGVHKGHEFGFDCFGESLKNSRSKLIGATKRAQLRSIDFICRSFSSIFMARFILMRVANL